MRLGLLLLASVALGADKLGLFLLRDSFENCKKIAYLTPAAKDARFAGEKDFDAESMEPGPWNAVSLAFFNGKLAKIVLTFKPEFSTKEQWKVMIALRRKQHESLDDCEESGNECYEWADENTAEKLVYDADKPSITTTLIDRPAFKKAVYKKK